MSKTTVTGSAIVVTSDLKLEDLNKLTKFRPEALVLRDENHDPVFAIAVTAGNGSLNEFGATFSNEVTDDAGHATLTLIRHGVAENVRLAVADKIGPYLLKLNKLEENLKGILDEVDRERAQMLDCIEVA